MIILATNYTLYHLFLNKNRSAKREKAETPAQPSAAQSSDITVEKLDEENGDELEDVDQLSQLSKYPSFSTYHPIYYLYFRFCGNKWRSYRGITRLKFKIYHYFKVCKCFKPLILHCLYLLI